MARRNRKNDGPIIELPAIPLFPYQSADVPPPVGVLLLLDIGGSYLLGDWNGRDFVSMDYTLIEPVYGKVDRWCIVLNHEQEVILVEADD